MLEIHSFCEVVSLAVNCLSLDTELSSVDWLSSDTGFTSVEQSFIWASHGTSNWLY
uniref:Uncharacterized protein n=1 Tax=Octopus bimaculoides TaxID=37653 RepID=A0A0L8FMI7_OCTBM